MSYVADGGRPEYGRNEYPDSIVCDLCKTDFTYSREKRTTKHTCHSCLANRHRFKLKAHMIDYKGGCCQLCGYAECFRSLDFHHMEPEQKGFHFGGKHNFGWDRLRNELDKCVLLCKNCHGQVEEALDLVVWGCRLPILDAVQAAHLLWEPPADFPAFSRPGWEEYHPKYLAAAMAAADFDIIPQESHKNS